jgi:hypothetical protein
MPSCEGTACQGKLKPDPRYRSVAEVYVRFMACGFVKRLMMKREPRRDQLSRRAITRSNLVADPGFDFQSFCLRVAAS